MFPFKARKPSDFKSASSASRSVGSKKRHRGDGDDLFNDTDAHIYGGNLQRAVLLDLVELRQRSFTCEISHHGTLPTLCHPSILNSSSAQTQTTHEPTGAAFERFKQVFSDARFGAIHTRTIPHRVDRGEYVQLLYSCCFYLLEEAMQGGSSTTDSFWKEVGVVGESTTVNNPSRAFNAMFAIFALYTLHQTNVLPDAMPPQPLKTDSKTGQLDEQALRKSWSTLPIGHMANEFRNTYRSPIRIDRWCYSLLLQLRDVCKAHVSLCNVDGVQRNDSILSNRCNCSLAGDAAHIIDKMLTNESTFDYCEYHGPCSLEGLAGSANFYKAHFATKEKGRMISDTTTTTTLSKPMLDSMGKDENLASLDLEGLLSLVQTHRSNLKSVSTQLHASRQHNNDLKPKQRELVECTLRGIFDTTPRYADMKSSFELEKQSDEEVVADEAQPKDPLVQLGQAKSSVIATGYPFIFPKAFSAALCDNIRGALPDFKDIVESIRKKVISENKGKMNGDQEGDAHPQLTTAMHQGLDFASFWDIGEDQPMDESVQIKDDASVATGAGRNALETLLRMVGGNTNTSHKRPKAHPRNKRKHLPQMDNEEYVEESDESISSSDDASGISGVGKNAIDFLLSQVNGTGKKTNQPARQRRKTKAKRTTQQKPKTQPHTARMTLARPNASSKDESPDDEVEDERVPSSNFEDDNDETMSMDESTTTNRSGGGGGLDALANLLSNVQNTAEV